MKSENIVVWNNDYRREVLITDRRTERRSLPKTLAYGEPDSWKDSWSDAIGAAYGAWHKMAEWERARLMVEFALDLAMRGYDLKHVIGEFAKVDCFRALGSESIPMCLVLTQVLCGRRLEPNTMTFEDLLENYKPETADV